MAERKVLLIVGNGFNHLLLNIVRNYPFYRMPKVIKTSRDRMVEVIERITYLFSEFKFLDILKENHNANDWEGGLTGYNKNCELLDNHKLLNEPFAIGTILKQNMHLLVQNQMKIVADKFSNSESQGSYKDIKRLLPSFGIKFMDRLRSNGITDLSIFTTNYDGILDTLLTDQSNNFLFQDSFGYSDIQNTLKFHPQYLYRSHFSMFHIHGSYKFLEKNGETFKIKAGMKNENPVMVLSGADSKEDIISSNHVLSSYYKKFISNLNEYDRVIIFGNSLNSEPHLKKAIKENFDRIGTELVICSNNPNKVEEQLTGYYNQFIYKFSTDDVIRELDLLNLFYQLFNEDLVNCSRCINDFNKAA